MRSKLFALVAAPLSCLAVAIFTACPVKTTTFNLPVSGVTTLIRQGGQVDTVNNCNPPTPPAPSPDTLSSGKSDEVFAGFDHWRNTVNTCQESKILIYRGLVKFDLTQLVNANKKGLISSATLDFTVTNTFATPQPANALPFCAGQLQFVSGAWAPGPPSTLNLLTQQFPAGGTVGGLYNFSPTFPLTPVTSGPIQTTPQGHFKIDVMNWARNWIDNGAANNGFMFSSANESHTLPVPTSDNTACHTHMADFKLTVNTL